MLKSDKFEKTYNDLTKHIRLNPAFLIWMFSLTALLAVCVVAYISQLQNGLSVTGLGDYVSWGLYISNFVFFVAASLIGMLISSVLILSGQDWAKPLARISEIIAFSFAAVAGLVIVSDMGMPHRLAYVFIYGRIQSPILWDVTVVTTYALISLLLYYIPLIPDLKILSDRFDGKPAIFKKVYKIISLGYTDTKEQKAKIHKLTRILAILIIPVALAIHTVTSWLFASTSRSGWDSTIFGPYFVTGAFVAGTAAVIIAMYFFYHNYKLKDYIKPEHFDKMAKLLVLVSLVYLYFNLNEFLVPGYKMKKADAVHLETFFTGHHALMFWGVQIFGLILPILLMLFKKVRTPLPMLLISLAVLIGAWLKRYLIVIPTQEHPFLPVQNVTEKFMHYEPTWTEILITAGPFILVLLIASTLMKFLPVIPIAETIEEFEKESNE
ncbi:MAG: polysulfide reductase NrfD [Bacteroidetes bacterium]|nr:polysulfide reductase NrfD [Bacteroidota bacterium]